MLERRENWPERLAAWIDFWRDEPFAWGTCDCVLFAAGAVSELTGANLLAGIEPLWESEAAAEAMLNERGGDLEAAVANHIAKQGLREWSTPRLAQRGDVAIFRGPMGTTLGIVGLEGTHALAPGPEGLVSVPLHRCSRAWHIGPSPSADEEIT